MNNPNVDYYKTIRGELIEDWADAHSLTLEEALDEGVCSSDIRDEIYVPHNLIRHLMETA